MTDLNPRGPRVTRHEIYTLIPHAKVIIFYLFTLLLLLLLLLLLILSGHIFDSCYYSVPRSIFRVQLHEVIPNSNLCWQPAKELTDKTSHEASHTV